MNTQTKYTQAYSVGEIIDFVNTQEATIRALEARVEELEAELEKEPVHCEYRGIEFWITELANDYTDHTYYGYQLRSPDRSNEGCGAFETKSEATRAAFARIENLTFNR